MPKPTISQSTADHWYKLGQLDLHVQLEDGRSIAEVRASHTAMYETDLAAGNWRDAAYHRGILAELDATMLLLSAPCWSCHEQAGYSLSGACLHCGRPVLTERRDIARMVDRHRRVHDCPYCDCTTLETMHELHPPLPNVDHVANDPGTIWITTDRSLR